MHVSKDEQHLKLLQLVHAQQAMIDQLRGPSSTSTTPASTPSPSSNPRSEKANTTNPDKPLAPIPPQAPSCQELDYSKLYVIWVEGYIVIVMHCRRNLQRLCNVLKLRSQISQLMMMTMLLAMGMMTQRST